MIIESIEQAYQTRSGPTATYPTHFLWLVVHGPHDPPWWRKVLRWLRRVG